MCDLEVRLLVSETYQVPFERLILQERRQFFFDEGVADACSAVGEEQTYAECPRSRSSSVN